MPVEYTCLLSTHSYVHIYPYIIMLYLMKACHLKLAIRTKVLSPDETKAVSAAVQLATPYEVAEAAMRISSLRNAIKNVLGGQYVAMGIKLLSPNCRAHLVESYCKE